MRVIIFGASGLLGKALTQEFAGAEVTGLSSKDAEIRNAQDVAEVVRRTNPEWVVLAAAYTDVDGCEKNRELAFDVNFQGAVNVAKAAKEAKSRLLFLSTDYVFDGTKTTPYETGRRKWLSRRCCRTAVSCVHPGSLAWAAAVSRTRS
jgi:dTDP-4-dehydrorhamnose reductase